MKKIILIPFLLLIVFMGRSQQLPGVSLLNDGNGLLPGVALTENRPFAGPSEISPGLAAALQAALDSLAEEYSAVGLSAALLLPDGEVWKGTSGINSFLPGDTLSTEMRMGMGSVTKTITGAAVMLLVEEGTLSLSDTVGQWLPAYPNVDPGITLRQLLNHTSGIYNYTDNPAFATYLEQNLDSLVEPEFVLQNYVEEPVFASGSQWGYSNTNYLLLGLIIEEAVGHPYRQVVRDRLLNPQGLTTMSLFPQEAPTGEMAHLWLDLTGNGVPDDFTGAGLSLNALFSMAWAAGAMTTTPEDLAHWLKNLMTGQVVSPATLDLMMDTEPVAPNFGYGLSLMNFNADNYEWWGHNGNIGYLTMALYSPDLDVSLVLISNSSPFNELDIVFFSLIQTWLQYSSTPVLDPPGHYLRLEAVPNPFSCATSLNIHLNQPSDALLKVTDTHGRLLFQTRYEGLKGGNNLVRLDAVAHWPAGLYQVALYGADWRALTKIVKE